MYALLAASYDRTDPAQFRQDLSEKDDVFSFWRGDRLVGFSTIMRRRIPELGGAIFLFSGDTVMAPDARGGRHLQVAFGRYVLMAKLRRPHRPLYWMLISKGYKTYLMMRRNYPYSFPSPAGEPPPAVRAALQGFYARKFGAAYDPASDIIDVGDEGNAASGDAAVPPDDLLTDPDVAYFLHKNPRYKEGKELACLAEIRLRDYLAIAVKYRLLAKPG
jgi:hypothetical protein